MIQFRFIENGLLKGQHCIYTTHEDMDISLIENEMADTRIDVEAFEKMNLLVICQIPDPRNYREGSVFGYDSIVKDILADLKRPSIFRMVSRAIPEVEEIEPRKRGKWIVELLQNHHAAIFIRKSWDGIAFNLE